MFFFMANDKLVINDTRSKLRSRKFTQGPVAVSFIPTLTQCRKRQVLRLSILGFSTLNECRLTINGSFAIKRIHQLSNTSIHFYHYCKCSSKS